ncbi:MAG: HAMP domain-containing sensor histidine kinase, partial [Myxococcota bacterium]
MWQALRSFFTLPVTADPEEVSTKLIWLVRLRWVALVAQLLSVLPALEFHLLEPSKLPLFLGVIGLLAAWNGFTWLSLRRHWKPTPAPILIQLCADITVLSTLLALSGGAWNPLVPILFVHSVLGAMLLPWARGLLFFALLLLCVIGIQAYAQIPPGLEGVQLPAPILFPAQFLVALSFWILTAWLSSTLTTFRTQLSESRERKTRIDRLRAVGALAAGLSHEFATPLNTAQLRLARLARSKDLVDDADLNTAREELDRCAEVLHHMAGSPLQPDRLALEVTELNRLVGRVCHSMENENPAAPIRLHVKGQAPYRVLIPTVAFSQGLMNLLDNAIQSGGTDMPVDVVIDGNTNHVDLSVSDRGEGWPSMVKSHLGEPFVTTKPNGVGLGLYYVHSLAEAIGAEFHL